MMAAVVPFPTAVVSEYLRTPAAPAACALYAGTFVLIAIGFWLVLLAAFRESVLDPSASEATVQRLRGSYRLGPPPYLLATMAAPFSPWLAMAICTGLGVWGAATTREC